MDRFISNQKASIAVTLSLVLIPFMCMLGAAIDYSAAERAKTELQNMLDSGSLTALSKSSASDAVVAIKAYLIEKKFSDATIGNVAIANTATGRTLTVTATASVPTMVLGHAIGSGSNMPISVTSKISGTFKPISYSFTLKKAVGWYSKDIFIWVKDGSGNLVSLTKTLSYDYDFATLTGTTVPPLNTATANFSLPPSYATGIMMRVYPTGTACGQTRAACPPTDYFSDAPNINLFLLRSGAACADVGGQSNSWEDGGNADFADFVYDLRCSVSSTELVNIRIDR